jgi:hypothetical protein
MTATRGRKFTIGKIVTMAYRLARQIPEYEALQPEALLEGQEYLELVLDSLQNEGGIAREVKLYELSLVAGTYQYDLDSDVLNIEGDVWYYEPGSANKGLLSVSKVSSDAWNDRGIQGETGTPTEYLIYRTSDSPQIWVYPTPKVAATVKLRAKRMLKDSNDSTDSADLEPNWHMYLVLKTAALVAQAKIGPQAGLALDAQAQRELVKCKSFAVEDNGGVFVPDLMGWRG